MAYIICIKLCTSCVSTSVVLLPNDLIIVISASFLSSPFFLLLISPLHLVLPQFLPSFFFFYLIVNMYKLCCYFLVHVHLNVR